MALSVRRLLGLLAFPFVLAPKLGPLRHVVTAAFAFVAFAILLVYVVAPIRGIVGHHLHGQRLRYDAERWMATAIFDRQGQFVGTFDPRLDSQGDVNWTGEAIELAGYTANPDHKSIPVSVVPEQYWQCLTYHEDRYIGGWLNPYGIDLMGVLKIPYSTIKRSIALRRPSLGVGGSTLPMQFARVIYKTPPSSRESGFTKLRRKLGEWWLAPVIYHELTRGGDDLPLKQWAANHLWLAQRTGGAPLHGVEMTSRIVFGKEAKDLTVAEQFVLASAVNKPIVLLPGNERLNAVREDHWRYITEVRARMCAEKLIADQQLKKDVLFELIGLAGGPPDPKVRPKLQEALDRYAPNLAQRATANPVIRANALLPAARFGLREEMKQLHGRGWREAVRGVTTTLDVPDNLAFGDRIRERLSALDAKWSSHLAPGFTLDPGKGSGQGAGLTMPQVIIAAANANGEIVRYFDNGQTGAYFGSPFARDRASARYDPAREQRRIASVGKMLVAIAAGNGRHDSVDTLYADALAPERGRGETCAKGSGGTPGERRALVAFACSLNRPLEWRAARLGQSRIRRLIDGFGFTMPPSASASEATPPSTAAVRGLISGSPQRVHHMASVVLAGLTGRGQAAVPPPTLVKRYDLGALSLAETHAGPAAIVPDRLMRSSARGFVRSVLQAPLCHRHKGQPQGTLKSLSRWCAAERAGLNLHFAKTGTDTTDDANQTVDIWVAGGLQFSTGRAYSYVVLVGTGSTSAPFGRSVHSGQVAAPLLEVLLEDLERAQGERHAGPAKAKAKAVPQEAAQARPRRRPVRRAGLRQRQTARHDVRSAGN
ncbi:MAG: transglycosylase domain-containing protein [Hyphomicrobiaceae bacterium]